MWVTIFASCISLVLAIYYIYCYVSDRKELKEMKEETRRLNEILLKLKETDKEEQDG